MTAQVVIGNKQIKKMAFDHFDSLAAQGVGAFVKFSVNGCRRELGIEAAISQKTFLRWYDEWCEKRFGDL